MERSGFHFKKLFKVFFNEEGESNVGVEVAEADGEKLILTDLLPGLEVRQFAQKVFTT